MKPWLAILLLISAVAQAAVPAHRPTVVEDPNGQPVARYGYDERGNRVSRTDAHGLLERYDHDAASRLIRVTARDGDIHEFSYDHQDRLATVTRPDGVTTYRYGAVGRLIQVEEGAIRLGYERV